MKALLIKLIKFYRKFISSSLKSECKYTPTCSVYALEVLEKRNIFYAIILIIWRLLRCNPFSKGGFDPPPDRKKDLKWLI
jgi:putative membrane protein insertion efficiency factor